MLSTQAPTPPWNYSVTDKSSSRVSNVASSDTQEPKTIDHLMRLRAEQLSSQPMVSYPTSGLQYVDYTVSQLDLFAFQAAKLLSKTLPRRVTSADASSVIALLGPSNLDYLVAALSISKLGHTVLFLSTRLSIEAYVSLLQNTDSHHLICDDSFLRTSEDLRKNLPELHVRSIVPQSAYGDCAEPSSNTVISPGLDIHIESSNIAWIIHSSGSTGLPKPIFQTHSAALRNYATNMNMRGFITLPLYHAHGISSLFRAISSGKHIHLYNASLPLTKDNLINVMEKHNFEIFYGVPYALKLLAETDEGIESLFKCKIVMFGGSPCPDDLGDKLVARGVNLISHYGTTETGQLMTSFRPQGDDAWDYVRPSEASKPFLRFEEQSPGLSPGLFELVCLNGWPSKVASNRPDNSYATKDLFKKHATLEAYKYWARLDDTLVLVNGEKANPLGMEGNIREHPLVAEAVVFGAGKPSCGLMVVPSSKAAEMKPGQILDEIWPSIEKVNTSIPAYARISRDMVVFLPATTEYPRTDKSTVIRAAFYRQFSNNIDDAYEERVAGEETELRSEIDLKLLIKEEVAAVMPGKSEVSTLTDDLDFFGMGMDSLQATQLRSSLVKQINTSGQKLGSNMVFEFPTIQLLSRHLFMKQSGQEVVAKSVEEQMRDLISKYGTFKKHRPCPGLKASGERVVVLTGVTGSLGAHIAANLASRPDISKIYCLARARSPAESEARVINSMRERQVYHLLSTSESSKLIALPSIFSSPQLGLGEDMYHQMKSEMTDMIHCAWSVNFRLQLGSFEKDCIQGTRNLMDLCLDAERPTPATFNFCSSVSTTSNTKSTQIPESVPVRLSYAQDMGYAQSKLVMENLIAKAAEKTTLPSRILRIGQIIGDTRCGIWNGTEAIPLMLQCATTIGALPRLDEYPSWLPVDVVSATIIEIALSSATSDVFNIVNHNDFHWTRHLLPKLHGAGLDFEELHPRAWIERLRRSDPDPIANPPVKLLEFFAGKYDNDEPRKRFVWKTEKARILSRTLNDVGVLNQDLTNKMVRFFKEDCWKKL